MKNFWLYLTEVFFNDKKSLEANDQDCSYTVYNNFEENLLNDNSDEADEDFNFEINYNYCFTFFFLCLYTYIVHIDYADETLFTFVLEFKNFLSFLFTTFFIFYFICLVSGFLFKHYLGLYGIFFLNIISIFFFWVSALLNINFFLAENNVISFSLFKWFYINNFIQINFDIYIDAISFSFMLLTLTIAFFVNIYTFSYFRYEPYINRLILLINAFVLSMLILVSSGNLIVFFFGWELIGLTSFFLINFWSERTGTLKSAFKAFSFNKISDGCIFTAIVLIYITFSELNFSNILITNFFKNEAKFNDITTLFMVNIITFFFLTAAFIKSAQVGFHVWLPDSMEAPVPASALIHSATLVSAGIFLILRFYSVLELSFYFHFILMFIGAITAFVGGASAAIQTDLKKILAYSTISHCGFLMFLCSLNNFNFVILYLFIHGFFKAAAFLCGGNIIRFSKNYQDLRRMGGYWKYLPAELFFMTFSLLNLSGLPFFFGFYIKHFLFISSDYFYLKQISLSFLFIAALTGIFYSFKLIFYIFFDFKKGRKSIYLDNTILAKKSKFYSNTTLSSNISIFFLIVFAYIISYIYLYFYILKLDSTEDFLSFFGKMQSFFFFDFEMSALYNYSFFYLTSIILIVLLIIFSWTYKFLHKQNIKLFFDNINIFFFW